MGQLDARSAATTEPKLPDEMGIWTDGGETIWLPKALYPKRSDAIRFAMEQFGCGFTDLRCLSRWMRYQPFTAYNLDGSVSWSEDEWCECGKDDAGAFQVWKLT